MSISVSLPHAGAPLKWDFVSQLIHYLMAQIFKKRYCTFHSPICLCFLREKVSEIVLSNKAILYSIPQCFHLLHASDRCVFCVFWNSSLTVASPIWPILQSTCLAPWHVCCLWSQSFYLCAFKDLHCLVPTFSLISLLRLVRMIVTQGVFHQITFFFCEDGWVIASENKTECYNLGNCQNIKLLAMAMSASTLFFPNSPF